MSNQSTDVIEQNRPVTIVGNPLPPIQPSLGETTGLTLPTISGQSFDGTDVVIDPTNGKPKLIIVVAHWCSFCQKELPKLVEWASQDIFPDGLEVILISTLVSPSKSNYPPSTWIGTSGWLSPVLADSATNQAFEALGFNGVPGFVAVSAKGTVQYRYQGGISEEGLELLLGLSQLESGFILGNSSNTGEFLTSGLIENSLKWSIPAGPAFFAADLNNIYATGGNSITAYSQVTGEQVWYNPGTDSEPLWGPPSIALGTVMVVSGYQLPYGEYTGNLIGFDANTGKQIWSYGNIYCTRPGDKFLPPLVLTNGLVVVQRYFGQGGQYILFIDPRDGSLKKQVQLSNTYPLPAQIGNQLIFLGGGGATTIDISSFEVGNIANIGFASNAGLVSPAVATENWLLMSASTTPNTGILNAYSLPEGTNTDGFPTWELKNNDYLTIANIAPTIADNIVVFIIEVDNAQYLAALDSATGNIIWKIPSPNLNSKNDSGLIERLWAIANGILYSQTQSGFQAMDLATGATGVGANGMTVSYGDNLDLKTPPFIANDKLFLCDGTNIYCFGE